MGGVSTPGGDGLNVDLNVVPFIDLLSSLVLFLLLGAVWVQISSMKASVEGRGPAAVATPSNAPSKRVEVQVTEEGYKIKWPKTVAGRPSTLAKKQGQWDIASLSGLLKAAASEGKLESGAVSATDKAPYGELVTAVDAIKEAGIKSVAVSTE